MEDYSSLQCVWRTSAYPFFKSLPLAFRSISRKLVRGERFKRVIITEEEEIYHDSWVPETDEIAQDRSRWPCLCSYSRLNPHSNIRKDPKGTVLVLGAWVSDCRGNVIVLVLSNKLKILFATGRTSLIVFPFFSLSPLCNTARTIQLQFRLVQWFQQLQLVTQSSWKWVITINKDSFAKCLCLFPLWLLQMLTLFSPLSSLYTNLLLSFTTFI